MNRSFPLARSAETVLSRFRAVGNDQLQRNMSALLKLNIKVSKMLIFGLGRLSKISCLSAEPQYRDHCLMVRPFDKFEGEP